MNGKLTIRLATPDDIPVLRDLIDASVRSLQAQDDTAAQLESALRTVYGVDTQLILDGTYFAVGAMQESGHRETVIVGCGGWSKRKTLYGGDVWTGREDTLLDARTSPAKIRAFFVHPDWARRGIGGMILDACESAAKSAGFTRLEMGATRTGVPFYLAKGYVSTENLEVPLEDGLALPIVRMEREIYLTAVFERARGKIAAGPQPYRDFRSELWFNTLFRCDCKLKSCWRLSARCHRAPWRKILSAKCSPPTPPSRARWSSPPAGPRS